MADREGVMHAIQKDTMNEKDVVVVVVLACLTPSMSPG
jgi:hypothetical protein